MSQKQMSLNQQRNPNKRKLKPRMKMLTKSRKEKINLGCLALPATNCIRSLRTTSEKCQKVSPQIQTSVLIVPVSSSSMKQPPTSGAKAYATMICAKSAIKLTVKASTMFP